MGTGDERSGRPGEPARMRYRMEIGARMSAAGDQALALKLLWAASTSGFWADRENDLSEYALDSGRAARRGDAAEALAVRAEQVGLQLGARAVLSVVQLARGLT
jgi:hypothetical protein